MGTGGLHDGHYVWEGLLVPELEAEKTNRFLSLEDCEKYKKAHGSHVGSLDQSMPTEL